MKSIAAIALLALLAGPADEAPSPAVQPDVRPDHVAVVLAEGQDYGCAGDPETARLVLEAPTRLVVVRGGRCVLDRGLRDERSAAPEPKAPQTVVERGIVEQAFVAPRGEGALVETVFYRDEVSTAEPRSAAGERFRGLVTLTWVDPKNPQGRWTVRLEPGRFVRKALALARGHGVAITTTDALGGSADFRLISAEGRSVTIIAPDQGTPLDIAASEFGGFVAVDVAMPRANDLPDRAVRVLDLTQGREWSYTWRYGSDEEPVTWSLEASGVLAVVFPGGTRRFDRNGRPIK